MCRKFYTAFFLTLCLALFWHSETSAQSFPYHLSVESLPGQCYDDARLIFTLTDDNGNVVQIDPQTHNAVNTAQYSLYNVQYHYKNVSTGGVQYDYDNDIMLMAGTYCVGVTANVPAQDGYAQVDTTICNVQLTTSYQHMEASVLSNMALGNEGGHERYGYRPSFHCADMGRIQLQITKGTFPYEVTILNEQQDTVRHVLFYSRVNSGDYYGYADYRDYYTFDTLPIGNYSIKVSDSCGYQLPLSFTIPDAEPGGYGSLVDVAFTSCPNETVIPFKLEIKLPPQNNSLTWYNYAHEYFDSMLHYRFLNPGGNTTEWRTLNVSSYYGSWNGIYDTLPTYCSIFNDTVKLQIRDGCRDTVMTFPYFFVPSFNFFDSSKVVQCYESAIPDTCAVHLQSGDSTQSYTMIGEYNWRQTGYTLPCWGENDPRTVPFRYYRCPLSYDVWSSLDSTLLGHNESDEFSGLGSWVTFNADTSVSMHISVTDAQGCQLSSVDTVFVYHPEPISDLFYWFECHCDKDDDGKDHCCNARYLWIQEHGVAADTFRRNMTLRLMDSPLYDQFNFTAVRQDGVWTVTPDDPDNHSTYVEFSYEDGWRATIRDSVCLPPGRYTFEVSTDCGVDTVAYEWSGYYWDSIGFTSPPQYEMQRVCDQIIVTQISTGLENYIYYVDPAISNDVPIQENCSKTLSYSIFLGGYAIENHNGNVFFFSTPGTYCICTRANNNLLYYDIHNWCSTTSTPYRYYYDTVTIAFPYLDFDMASALLCDATSTTGIVSAQAVNGNPPYTYTLYDQPGTAGNVIASNSTGYFDNVPMTVGQQFSVLVTDSCSTSFSVNVTAVMLTQGSLLWEPGATAGAPHLVGDTAHLTALTFPPPASYQWTGPNGFTSTSQEVDIVLPDSSCNGWYYLQILNSFCGSVITDSIYITVVPPPQVIVFYDTVCQGESYSDNGFTLVGAETSMPGTFSFTRLEQTGYYADTIILHLTINPSVDTIVEVTALGSYTWHGATYTSSGSYSRSADGCSWEILLLTITDTLGVTVVTDDDSLCRGESTTLHAQVSNAYVLPPVAVGDILCTDGDIVKPADYAASGKTAHGVVFYVDTTGAHGWAVHLHDQSEQVRWSTVQVDVPGVSNHDNFHVQGVFPDFDGYANTQALWAAGDSLTYPAAHTVDFPHGWYLPDVGQLDVLFSEMTVLNPSLQIVGGTPFPTDEVWFYWSSTESAANNPNFAWFVCSNGLVDYWGKPSSYYNYHGLHYEDMVEGHLRVRSIRDF